ncbi:MULTISPECIES: YnjH family protein [Pantoea]|uniref:YnjH family protein n=1 Tax=Pantoea TaxID=53335 RepID=UPI000496A7B0|nr:MULTISPECIES: YnjH family protein [Pantoea]MCS4497059.1 YnjH family protein [Pantoea sp. B623]MDC7866583.1 hypothetical protein [Pantoea ananatis]NEK80310.1 YnjH family protein [Pantoea ananatis]REF12277.1 uncharacterized protein DUF1496 [Pantoea ananatis]
MSKSAWLILIAMAACSPAHANYHQQGAAGGTNTDVIVDMPPEVWTQGQNSQQNCLQCCIFENRNYTEGAVVKSEGVLLQCARDEKSLGTNNLIWKIVK